MRQNISQPLTYIYSGRGDLSERVKKAAEYIDETTLGLIRLQSGLWSFFSPFLFNFESCNAQERITSSHADADARCLYTVI